MKYICDDCGWVGRELKMVSESRGEFWGVPCYEDMYYCPNCGSGCIDECSDDVPDTGLTSSFSTEDEIDEYEYYCMLMHIDNGGEA